MDEIRERLDDLVFRLEDYVKDEKSQMVYFDESCVDADGAVKRRTYATD